MKFYYSGMEGDEKVLLANKHKISHCLVSYYHARSKPKHFLAERKEKFPNIKWMVDSGGFSFIQSMTKINATKFEEYGDKYMRFCEDNQEYVDAVCDKASE